MRSANIWHGTPGYEPNRFCRCGGPGCSQPEPRDTGAPTWMWEHEPRNTGGPLPSVEDDRREAMQAAARTAGELPRFADGTMPGTPHVHVFGWIGNERRCACGAPEPVS